MLSKSMRDNYSTKGVAGYYQEIAAQYRNPHFLGIRKVLELFLDAFWSLQHTRGTLKILDFGAGSGEATQSILNWQRSRWPFPSSSESARPAVKENPVALLPGPLLELMASDPFTAANYTSTTGLPCLELSFQDVADDKLPEDAYFDLVICSYSLHLLTNPSELFAFLDALKSRCRYLVVIAPHKLPQIKEHWGFSRIHPLTLRQSETTNEDEIMAERARLRVYESVMNDNANAE